MLKVDRAMPGTASATTSVVWFYLKNLYAIYLYIHLLTITKGMYLLVNVCVYVCGYFGSCE